MLILCSHSCTYCLVHSLYIPIALTLGYVFLSSIKTLMHVYIHHLEYQISVPSYSTPVLGTLPTILDFSSLSSPDLLLFFFAKKLNNKGQNSVQNTQTELVGRFSTQAEADIWTKPEPWLSNKNPKFTCTHTLNISSGNGSWHNATSSTIKIFQRVKLIGYDTLTHQLSSVYSTILVNTWRDFIWYSSYPQRSSWGVLLHRL